MNDLYYLSRIYTYSYNIHILLVYNQMTVEKMYVLMNLQNTCVNFKLKFYKLIYICDVLKILKLINILK